MLANGVRKEDDELEVIVAVAATDDLLRDLVERAVGLGSYGPILVVVEDLKGTEVERGIDGWCRPLRKDHLKAGAKGCERVYDSDITIHVEEDAVVNRSVLFARDIEGGPGLTGFVHAKATECRLAVRGRHGLEVLAFLQGVTVEDRGQQGLHLIEQFRDGEWCLGPRVKPLTRDGN